ncbi:MAG: hypothetical protein JKY86_02180 [Gammaproteobacteria bacterium]|nr:hypothetical protein [Gammaproteobacteria bacterium]
MHPNSDTPKDSFEKRVDPAQQGLPPFEDDKGTKPSNTVPPTSINQSSTRILRTGVDSLYLSYQGDMHADAAIRLSELKHLAQSDKGSDAVLAQFKVGDQLLEVLGHGRPPYTYVLVDGWFRLEVAKEDAVRLPMAYCKIASSLLTAMGHDSAVDALNNVISAIGSTDSQPNVSRIDICADFTTDHPLDQLAEREFVTKARSFSRHTVAREFSGFSFSAGSPTSGRLYNKTLEMVSKNRPRPDLELQWRQSGWDGVQDVWRLEFQFRRETLAAFKLVPYKDAVSALPDLWKYATRNWIRHTLPSSTDDTQSRWSTSPFWKSIQGAEWDEGIPNSMSRTYPDKGRTPSDKFLFVNGLSTLTSFAAKEGYINAGEAMEAYLEAAREFHDNRSGESAAKGRKKGADVDFAEYFRQKIESKRRSYNTAENRPLDDGVHPADKAVAREYKKRSDGE